MSVSIDPVNIKALAFDLDGTLLAPGAVLTKRTVQSVRRCAVKGIQIIIATGRAIESAEKYREALGASGPMVYYNGAIVADMADSSACLDAPPRRKILHSTLLDPGAVDFCIDLSRTTGVYFQAYFPGSSGEGQVLMAERDAPEREAYFKSTEMLAELGPLKEILKGPGRNGFIKAMFLAESPILDSLRPHLEERFGNSVYLARTKATYLELMNAGVSKGEGLAIALKNRGIGREQTIAFGDEENDLPMFKAAAYSVAPDNAVNIVKAAADFIVPSNSEDGIADFLEKLFS